MNVIGNLSKHLVLLSLASLGQTLPFASAQQDGVGAHYESQGAGRPRVIIFVHGFTGTAADSWRARNGNNFPTLLATDDRVKQANVFVASYETRMRKDPSTISSLAEILFGQLSTLKVISDHNELIFVCHSLGGLVVERMLIEHSDLAAKTVFIQFYGTPHEGILTPALNPLLNFAKILGENSIIPELRAGSGNEVLVQLDQDWKSKNLGHIHRFCAIELRRTIAPHVPDVFGILVPYFSGSYGCDSSVPIDRIDADHVGMVKTSDRTGPGNEAYLILLRNYRDNPYYEWRTSTDPNRYFSQYFVVDCNHTTSNPAYPVTFSLNDAFNEELVQATAEWKDAANIQGVNPNPPIVQKVSASTVNVAFGFNGLDKDAVGNCPGGGHASLVVHPTFRSRVPVPDG